MIYIAGRPMRDFTIDITEVDGCLVLRLDDRQDPEYWLEVTISDEDLVQAQYAVLKTRLAQLSGREKKDIQLQPEAGLVLFMQPGREPPGPCPEPSDN